MNNFYARGISDNLALAGGCGPNSSYNGQILDRTKFKRLHVPSAPSDDGNALGVGLLILHDTMELSYKFRALGHQAENWIMSAKKNTEVVPDTSDCAERSAPAYSPCRTERGASFREGAAEPRRSHGGESRPNFVLKKDRSHCA